MAKKTPVKKSKRRLKRSVRRSLAAVLMITAIGVAAVPVPENYASPEDNGGIVTYAAADKHQEDVNKNFKYEPDEKNDEDLGEKTNFKLGYYQDDEPEELAKILDGTAQPPAGKPMIYASLAVTDTGSSTIPYSLSWQFMYYEQTNPDGGGSVGVLCKYNKSYYVQDVTLELNPVTEYFAVRDTDIVNYFNPDNWADSKYVVKADNSNKLSVVMDGTDPTEPVTYTYQQYQQPNYEIDYILTHYFNAELQAHIANKFADYDRRKALADEAGQEFNEGPPEAFSRAPIEITGDLMQTEYFMEHCDALQTAFGMATNPISVYQRADSSKYETAYVNDLRPGRNNGFAYLVKAKSGVTISQGKYSSGNYGFLATEPTEYPIQAIGNKAFKGVENVKKLTIPGQMKSIGNEAFMGASLLESISFENAPVIGNRAFKNCYALTSVNLGTATRVIGQECFSGSYRLQSITFGDIISTIGYGAFKDCTSLTSISFASNGAQCEIKGYAFYNCAALGRGSSVDGRREISLADTNIVSLGEGAFAVDVGVGTEQIGFVLPQNMFMTGDTGKDIGNFLFAGRAGLQYVVFPSAYGAGRTVKIPDSVFHGCTGLQYVQFPTEQNKLACGYVQYNDILFADVLTDGFYVRGPRINSSGDDALPRVSTWEAKTARSNTVPYIYVDDDGVEFYEVSDGYYLLCINNEGSLTSCRFTPTAEKDKWVRDERWVLKDGVMVNEGGEGGKLVIPAVVGGTRVTGIDANCFRDSELNSRVKELVIEDNSISTIAGGAFKAGSGTGATRNDWHNLEKVYIGNSVTSIGASAFQDCSSLVDVTFGSPGKPGSGKHGALEIGEDAFKTQSDWLVFHGDIVEGYAPFDWATRADNIIKDDGWIRVCYKSLAPTYLTVMYNPITEMVTLLDYPKYNEISSILKEAHADEIKSSGYDTYEEWKAAEWYYRYRGSEYDDERTSFAQEWLRYKDMAIPQGQAEKEAFYSSLTWYGPWVNQEFCDEWNEWTNGNPHPGGGGAQEEEEEEEEEDGDDNSFQGFNALTDWLFEPIVAYAAEGGLEPYYDVFKYDVTKIVGGSDEFRIATSEEEELVYNTQNITIPAGVKSIDVLGYVKNLTKDGEESDSQEKNRRNYTTYLSPNSEYGGGWDRDSERMCYTGDEDDEDDNIKIVPGLFSGYYDDSAVSESRIRGNDLIVSVTMNSVEYLPDYAFDSCENLTRVVLGPECMDIGKAPFRGCYSLTSVGDNAKYTTVNGIIYSKNADGTLTIEECLPARGNKVGDPFVSTTSDPNLDNVSIIKPGAFEDCDFLNDVNLGKESKAGLAVIPDDCFRNCDRLQTVVLPMSINDVGKGAFMGAKSLTGLTIYGKEVKISGSAFSPRGINDPWITIHAYEDTAVSRYVDEYGDEYHLRSAAMDGIWLVYFYDANFELMKDPVSKKTGEKLENPQLVDDGYLALEPVGPVMDGWTFERWVGTNNVSLEDPIHEDSFFYAQGYSNNGMVNGRWRVEFYDGFDFKLLDTQYVEPGGNAYPPRHPVHAGYIEDGYSDTYTNIQSNKTIHLKYKQDPSGSGGNKPGTSSGSSTNTSGTSSGSSTNTPGTSSGSSTNTPGTGTGSSTSTTSTTSATSETSTSASSDSTSTPSTLYTLTVNNGSGSGNYAAGTTVWIMANDPAAGQVFSRWVTETQGVTLASVSSRVTSFTMPASNVTITAEYAAGISTVSGTGNNGSGSTGNNGSTRVDITKPGISNKDLATANVNGSTDNFIVRISETDEATRAVQAALTNKYGSLDNLLYYAMDISLYDATGTVKITDTTGITVDITIPIPDSLVAFGGNNMAGAVINGDQLENLNESFTAINGVPCIRFTATHFSPYTVYVDTGNLTEGLLDTTPKTGDPIHPKWFLSIGLACLSVILFMKKDKAVKVKTA